MFLKTLSIKGFKSFADSAVLDLEPGISVVVGPNGSGKSNVVDAIGWVLGAQAPSAVRSQKMEDVIFAGTSERPALGRAEVSLTLDNSAGLLDLDVAEVTITRTLFRTGESEYAINGVPCRLLDVQELLSDSGVGRQQHVIISQGQIDAILNARPEDRRMVIEEAAGVLKYRRRKERSERRLAATEGNLNRLQDLLREVRRQIRPLERQAEAAQRHGDLLSELHQLRIHQAGREYAELRERSRKATQQRAELSSSDRELSTALAALDAQILETEAELGALGGDDMGDSLVRIEGLRAKGKGQLGVITERRRGVDRDREAFIDRDVVASLESDLSRVRQELAQIDRDAEHTDPERAALDLEAEQLATDRNAFAVEMPEGSESSDNNDNQEAARLAAERADGVRRRLGELRAGTERARAELDRTAERVAGLTTKQGSLSEELARIEAQAAAADGADDQLAEAHALAETERVALDSSAAEAELDLRRAESELGSWEGRADALALALDEARARAGAERLDGVEGVVGTLADVVQVDEGWESRFESAAGDALSAIVLDSAGAGREAVELLRSADVSGAILALGVDRPNRATPPVGEPVRNHVRALRPDVEALLDALIGSAISVDGGWSEALDAALAYPDAIVVTDEGDRFGAVGWRIGAGGTGATGAALEEAQTQAEVARTAHAAAEARLAELRTKSTEARKAEQQALRAIDDNAARSRQTESTIEGLRRQLAGVETEQSQVVGQTDSATERLERELAEVDELSASLPSLEAAAEHAAQMLRARTEAEAGLERRARDLAERRAELDVRSAGFVQRRQLLERRLAEIEARLERDAADRAAAEGKVAELDRREIALDRLSAFVAARMELLDVQLNELRERRRLQSEAVRVVSSRLETVRTDRKRVDRELASARERLQRLDLDQAEIRVRVETAAETLRRDLDCEPRVAMETECPELPEGVQPAARLRELERELKLLGPINPLAVEEYNTLKERHEFLQAQLDDVKTSRRELGKVIAAIDAEIVNVFAAAYADVSQNFEKLFETLFPGGRGRLKLTNPDDLLSTGIEIEARPSGKNVRKLSLLSGGERSLTALAYLFAIFRARPSPFYVMDEVEAALDDMNLNRFLNLLAEFRGEAQLIVVSHQKRTMEAADCLYGVSMKPGGSSQVLSERIAKKELAADLAG